MNIGYNIKRIREIIGYSQKAVADILGMSETGYGNIERGEVEVKEKRLKDIAEALGVTTEIILQFNPDTIIHTASVTSSLSREEKEFYENIIKEKDREIDYLKQLIKKKR